MDAVTVLTIVVVVETLVVALLAVIVVSLLRSHAEVLRRLPSPEEEEEHAHGRQVVQVERSPGSAAAAEPGSIPSFLPGPRDEVTLGHDIGGRTLQGDTVAVSVTAGPPTLVAFLSSGCLTCRTFWDGLRPEVRRPLPGGARLVVVVKDRELESPSKLLELAPDDVMVIHSSEAYEQFGISMSPYFCFVDGVTGEVRSEGAAMTWDQVRSLLTDAIMDEDLARREAPV